MNPPVFEHPRKVLASLGLTPRKSMGQNFLCDSQTARRLVERAELLSGIGIVEIGPGLGAMTRWLVELEPWFLALEADEGLARYLQGVYASFPHARVLHADALEVRGERSWLKEIPAAASFQVVGNLPYSCGTEILFRLMDFSARIPRLAVMVQREVGERLTAQPGTKDYGRLSILPTISYEIVSVQRLGGGQFYPAAKVESDFLVFRRRSAPLIDLSRLEFATCFDQMVTAIFGFRRKTLRNALGRMPQAASIDWPQVFERAQIDEKRRGETLSITEMERLTQQILQAGG